MYKPRITRVLLCENPQYMFATVYYSGNVRRTYRRRLADDKPLPKTVRNFMHSQDVRIKFADHSNCFVPWKQWTYEIIR